MSGLVLKDNDDSRTLAIPGGTSIPAGGFLAVDTDVGGGFGLGSTDAARVFMPDGTTLIDGYSWTSHASHDLWPLPRRHGRLRHHDRSHQGRRQRVPGARPSHGRAARRSPRSTRRASSAATSAASTTRAPAPATRACSGPSTTAPARCSGCVWDGTQWVRDTANGWSAGKPLRFPGGAGLPDSEGVTLTDAGSAGGVFVSSERNLAASATSRVSVLRYDVSGAGTTLTATQEWNLTADLPAVGTNAGAESVEWVPDTYLVGSGFVDADDGSAPTTRRTTPTTAPGCSSSASRPTGSSTPTPSTRPRAASPAWPRSPAASRPSGRCTGTLTRTSCGWSATTTATVAAASSRSTRWPTQGIFAVVADYARPTGMANLNNEGFTITPDSECVGGSKPVYWADDGNTAGHALRAGTIPCTPASPPIGRAGWSASTTVKGDFNGDGFGDLAIGAPGENVGASRAAPSTCSTGSASGLTARRARSSGRRTPPGSPTPPRPATISAGRWPWATSTATAFDDLAIGAPGEDVGAVRRRRGPRPLRERERPDRDGEPAVDAGLDAGSPTPRARRPLRRALAAGNLNSDAFAELVDRRARRGHRGGRRTPASCMSCRAPRAGLTGTGSQNWSQNSAGIVDAARPATASAPRSRSAISAASPVTTSRSACPTRTSARSSTPASSTCSRLGDRPDATGSSWSQNSSRDRRRRRDRRRLRRRAGHRQRSAATRSATSSSACPARASARSPAPVSCMSCRAPPPA